MGWKVVTECQLRETAETSKDLWEKIKMSTFLKKSIPNSRRIFRKGHREIEVNIAFQNSVPISS